MQRCCYKFSLTLRDVSSRVVLAATSKTDTKSWMQCLIHARDVGTDLDCTLKMGTLYLNSGRKWIRRRAFLRGHDFVLQRFKHKGTCQLQNVRVELDQIDSHVFHLKEVGGNVDEEMLTLSCKSYSKFAQWIGAIEKACEYEIPNQSH
jgi:hypothetical protein